MTMKHFLKNISLSFLSIIIFFTLAEIITRLFWQPSEINSNVREGVILQGANKSLVYEGINYQINSEGIRNRELTTKKDTGTIRILALGDSFIWGDGLKNEDLITLKLENNLINYYGDNIEVINAGIGGFNTQDEYEQLMRLYPVYKPDVVIQFFFTNDLLSTDSTNQIKDIKVVYHMWMRKHSKFYSFLYYLIKSTINSEISFPSFILPQDYYNLDDTKPGWVNFKEYTNKIELFCDKNNLNYCFVLIPTLTNLDSNYPYKEVNEKVTDYVHSLKIPFLSYFNLFSKYKPTDLWVSKENTHWNGFATSLAAEELTKFIVSNKILESRIK